jgi:hypothetical protein
MGKNTVEPGRPQMTIWRKRIEYCISKTTNTHSEYVIITFPRQKWLREGAIVLRYMCIAVLILPIKSQMKNTALSVFVLQNLFT